MSPDLKLNIAQLVLTAVATVIAILFLPDEQVAALMGLTATDLSNPAVLISRLGTVFRLALFPTMFVIFTVAFAAIRRIAGIQTEQKPVVSKLVPEDQGLKEAIAYLTSHSEAYLLRVWGYSLNWASDLSLFLAENRREKLAVMIFVPSEEVIGGKFADNNAEERKAMRRLRLAEWKQLAERQMVANVTVFTHSIIPNDLGIMLDDKLAFVGTYDWESRGGQVWHRRQPLHARVLLKLSQGSTDDEYLIERYRRRFVCREYDAVEKI